MLASKLRHLSPSAILSKLGLPQRAAMTSTATTDVATSESWPISVTNISKNLVAAQYAGD